MSCSVKSIKFNCMHIWIKEYDLLTNCLTVENARLVGSLYEGVVEIVEPNIEGELEMGYLRLKVVHDLSKPFVAAFLWAL